MSRQMKSFADYFMQGMALGGGWAEKWQAQQIAKERNRIMGERNAAVDKRENTKLGLYGEQVRANAELARARAHAALNPKARGGGGGGAAPSSADAEALRREAAERGIISAPPAPVQAAPVNITVEGGGDGGTTADPPAPVEGGYGETESKGGMVGSKMYASGGIVEGMSLEEAQSYQGKPSAKEKPKADPFSSSMQSAAGKYKAPEEKKPATPEVTPRGPMGSGVGGSYTTADTGPGGVISTGYAEGGAVGRQQDLTQPYDYKQAESTLQRQTQAEQTEETQRKWEQEYGTDQSAAASRGQPDFASSFNSASANGATGSGGDATGGVSGTGGIGGSATGGAGGSAAAGTSGDAGSDGSGTYRRGGQVRRFQSGGRVMEAIDTGTTGPGSGYGYRAAPPANARR